MAKEIKIKSPRNKTIDFNLVDGAEFAQRNLDWSKSLPDQAINLEDIINQNIIGDSFSILPLLPKQCADLIIVDPPYNLSKEYHGNTFSKTDGDSYKTYTKQWVEKILPLLKNTGSLYVCCDWKSSMIIGPVLEKYFIVRNRITWQREKGRGASNNWKNGMEDIWYCTLSNTYTFNLDAVKIRKKVIAPYKENGKPKDWEEHAEGKFRDTCPSNFWDDISIPFWSMPENTAHPTQKPEKLLAKLILASSKEGDLVLDPFAGSGSTLVTAKKLNRQFIGIEQNMLYGAWTQYRLEEATKKQCIQGMEKGVFFQRNF